ncbi:hypothetical protein [Nocardia paucivorans]|uniref:hypothetical protein n=1 Tax=Nocardia paucivorans TaxID=114259 RepID=UPI00031D538D|nr:hypothetical protein [Nocardia paucivorans]
MRKRAILRGRAERDSYAPRFVDLSEFSSVTGVDWRTLARWLDNGPIWVPTPAVVLGGKRRPGWEPEIPPTWEPGLNGAERQEPREYLDITQMKRRYGMSEATLWVCIVEDRTIPMPAMWLAGQPGWLPH